MSLLEQDIISKKRVNKLELKLKLKVSKNKEYKVEVIKNNTLYINEAAGDQLPGLYYLVSWKDYSEVENT